MSDNIQKLNIPNLEEQLGNPRVETGPLRINDDWCGTFIRGDNAAFYAFALRRVLDTLTDEQKKGMMLDTIAPLEGLYQDLTSSRE